MFSFLGSAEKSVIVVDVGSSSVGVAIVCILPDETVEVIWEYREYCLIRSSNSPNEHLKQIKTAIINAFLELSHTGLRALKESEFSTEISEVQSIISAPWSHTITKTISLKDEHPIEVTEEMIDEMVTTAKKQSKLTLATNEKATNFGLSIAHGDVIDISINEYSILDPIGQKGRNVALTYLETAIAEGVIGTLSDSIGKFFPKAKQTTYSFMYAFYVTLKHMHPNTSEVCLIDVTGEATEIGVVRDGVLRHTTYIPHGTYTIARELSESSGVTKEEAYSYMKDTPDSIVERLSKADAEKVHSVLTEYQSEVADLFLRTGDVLTIPKSIFLHTDTRTEEFFLEQLAIATKQATGERHTVHPVTTKVLQNEQMTDTAIVLAINFIINKQNYLTLLPQEE